jgi:hypothetical protein
VISHGSRQGRAMRTKGDPAVEVKPARLALYVPLRAVLVRRPTLACTSGNPPRNRQRSLRPSCR